MFKQHIISPEFSFLNFGLKEYPECYDIEPMPLPKCGDLAIKAQIEFLTDELIPVTTPYYVAIADTACNVIEDEDINIAPICSTYKFRTYATEETELPDLGEDNIYNLCYDEGAPIETITFDANPFDEITSTTLDFVILTPIIYNGIQLYIGGKSYIMEYDFTFVSSSYSFTQMGDTYFVKLRVGDVPSAPASNLKTFLVDVVDVNHGTTSTTYLSAGVWHIQILNVPAGSYFNTYGAASSVTGTIPSTNIGRFFYYTGSGVAYKNLYSIISASTYYEFQDTLSATDIVRYVIEYNAVYNDFEFEITIDDGLNPVTTIPATISEYTGNIW